MPSDAIKIVEITELPRAEAAVHRAQSGLARPNRALADKLSIEHRVSHELLVRAVPHPAPQQWTAEEKLLRAIFGEKALDSADSGDLAEVGARLLRYQNVIHHPQARVVFSAADEGEVESVERDAAQLPDGFIERITVIVRFPGPLSVGDELWSGAEKLGLVDAIVEDGLAEPRLYVAEGAENRTVLVERRLPTATQRMEARAIGPYDLVTHQPLSGEVLRDEQLVWLVANGARALVSDFATYKTDDHVHRTRAHELLTKLDPIPDGWSACHPAPATGPPTIFAFFEKPATSLPEKLRRLDIWARACGLAITLEDHALRISRRVPDDTDWSHGAVLSAATLSDDNATPVKGGLLCQKVFGPIRDYKCACGKYKMMSDRGKVCEKCGVEVIRSSVRRERLGHVELATPIVPAMWRSIAGARPWSALPIAPPDLRPEGLNNVYSRVIEHNDALRDEGDEQEALQASVDEAVEAAVMQLREALAPRAPRRTDYSGSAAVLIDDRLVDRCSVPLPILTEMLRPILLGILEAHGYATTIRSAKDLLARDEKMRREMVRMAMFDRVLLFASPEPGEPTCAAMAIDIGDDPVIRVPRALAARLGLQTGETISVHLPLSDAAQLEAKALAAGTLAAPPIADAPSWIRDVTRAHDVPSRIAELAAEDASDPCSWPPAAMLIGGYPFEGPPPPAIELGPPPATPEPPQPPAELLHPVIDLELTPRTSNLLQRAGIETLLDLVRRTDSEMLKIKGFSRVSLKEVKNILEARGLSLGMRV